MRSRFSAVSMTARASLRNKVCECGTSRVHRGEWRRSRGCAGNGWSIHAALTFRARLAARRRRRGERLFEPEFGIGAGNATIGMATDTTIWNGASMEARKARPASVISQPALSRTTNSWLKMSSAGACAASWLVRDVHSGPLEMRMLTQRESSATERRPSGCPAKTFKMVIWKLTVRPKTSKYSQGRQDSWINVIVGSVSAGNRVVHRFRPSLKGMGSASDGVWSMSDTHRATASARYPSHRGLLFRGVGRNAIEAVLRAPRCMRAVAWP